MTLEEAAKRVSELEIEIDALRKVILTQRALREYPPGHPEEPGHLKKFREQNPNWRDYQD